MKTRKYQLITFCYTFIRIIQISLRILKTWWVFYIISFLFRCLLFDFEIEKVNVSRVQNLRTTLFFFCYENLRIHFVQSTFIVFILAKLNVLRVFKTTFHLCCSYKVFLKKKCRELRDHNVMFSNHTSTQRNWKQN